jgi:basic membrane protein A
VVTTADTGAVGSYAASVRAELERFAQAHDSEVNWYATTRPQEIDRAAARFRTVFLVGGRYASVALAAAKRHPATHFFLLDAPDRTGRASPPNLTAMRIERGHLTYEAGRAAAAVSRTSHVGVVFPRRTATTTALAAAFRTGAQDKAPGITVRIDYSTTGQAGVPELARRQLTGGADVVFGDRAALAVVATSAGAPGQTWFIGMDDDYGAIAPKPQRSYVLTSVVPRLDLGVKQACRALVAGTPSKIGRYAPFTSDVVLSTAGGHLASVPGALTSPRDRSGELRPAYGSPFPEEH